MLVDTEDLVGIKEAADILGVPRRNIGQWIAFRNGNGFPHEILRLSMGPIFSKQQILTWHPQWKARRAEAHQRAMERYRAQANT